MVASPTRIGWSGEALRMPWGSWPSMATVQSSRHRKGASPTWIFGSGKPPRRPWGSSPKKGDRVAVEALKGRLADLDDTVRQAAAEAVGQLAERGDHAVLWALTELLAYDVNLLSGKPLRSGPSG